MLPWGRDPHTTLWERSRSRTRHPCTHGRPSRVSPVLTLRLVFLQESPGPPEKLGCTHPLLWMSVFPGSSGDPWGSQASLQTVCKMKAAFTKCSAVLAFLRCWRLRARCQSYSGGNAAPGHQSQWTTERYPQSLLLTPSHPSRGTNQQKSQLHLELFRQSSKSCWMS